MKSASVQMRNLAWLSFRDCTDFDVLISADDNKNGCIIHSVSFNGNDPRYVSIWVSGACVFVGKLINNHHFPEQIFLPAGEALRVCGHSDVGKAYAFYDEVPE